MTPWPPDEAETVVAQRFVVVDPHGAPRGAFGMGPDTHLVLKRPGEP